MSRRSTDDDYFALALRCHQDAMGVATGNFDLLGDRADAAFLVRFADASLRDLQEAIDRAFEVGQLGIRGVQMDLIAA